MAISKETQIRVREYQKCKKDILYFIENYIRIEVPGKTTSINLYKPQKDFLKTVLKDHYVTLLKTRQTGGSTAAQMLCCWLCTFYKNAVIGIVSRGGNEATDFARKVISMINYLPDWMQPKFIKDTERTFILDNGCALYAECMNLANPGALFRGKSITLGIIDEAAHIARIDDGFTAFSPTLFKAHQVAKQTGVPYGMLVISTPNRTVGIGKFFYEMWTHAVAKTNMFTACKLYWKDIPDFRDDKEWYDTQCKLLDNNEGKIAQELEMQFLGSTDSWLPLDTVKKLYESVKEPISQIKMRGGFLNQWVSLDISKHYIIGIDTASAGGGDRSAIEIFDYETMDQVAEFQGKLEVFDFCQNIADLCRMYPKHIIIPEDNSYGNEVVGYLRRMEESENGPQVNLYKMNPKKLLKQEKTKIHRYGVNTNIKTRPLMMDALYTFVTQFPELIKSESLVLELAGLIEKEMGTSFKVEADKGMRDDLALSLAFICYVRKYDPPLHLPVVRKDTKITVDRTCDIAEWNDDEKMANDTVSNFVQMVSPESEKVSIGSINKALSKAIKENLHKKGDPTKLKHGGARINVFDFMKEWNG